MENHLELPKISTIHVVVADEQDHSIFDKHMAVAKDGTVTGDLTLPRRCAWVLHDSYGETVTTGRAEIFGVEEYKKPEYQVRVSAAKPRVLQGETNQVVIDSRYFFGEPVANAQVKYRIYHSRIIGGRKAIRIPKVRASMIFPITAITKAICTMPSSNQSRQASSMRTAS